MLKPEKGGGFFTSAFSLPTSTFSLAVGHPAQQKSPLKRAGFVFLKVIYFFASGLASVAGAASAGAGVGTMVSTHSRIALCEASPLRWPSLMMRV